MRAAAVKTELPYLHRETTRHGQDVIYARRFGRRVRIREAESSPAFMEAYAGAVRELSGRRPVRSMAPLKPAHPAGSLGWLGAKYFGSPKFLALSPGSQATRRGVLEACFAERFAEADNKPLGDCPAALIDAAKIQRLRDLKSSAGLPGAANNRKKYLSAMFGWAVEQKPPLATHNPVRDVKRVDYSTSGFHTWTIEEVEQFRARHAVGTKARLALEMLLFIGCRRGDFVTLGKQHVRNNKIRFVPRKTLYKRRTSSAKPVLPILAEVIAKSPCGAMTFLETEHGKPFTAKGFGGWFRERCDDAKLYHCTAHGLRKAGATFAAQNGATVNQLMAMYDWSTPNQAKVYTDAVDRERLADQGMPLLMQGGT